MVVEIQALGLNIPDLALVCMGCTLAEGAVLGRSTKADNTGV